jgi:glutaminase
LNYPQILEKIEQQVEPCYGQGNVAAYIPQLASVNPRQFAMALSLLDQQQFSAGDAEVRFSIQSVSKVFSLMLAVSLLGEQTYHHVGVEPSGDPFNSLVQLEHELGFPRNPFINAGALVVADILLRHLDNPKVQMLEFVRKLAGDDQIDYDESVALSEQQTGFRNYAMVNFLKSFNRIENSVDDVLDLYIHQCALAMTCNQLATAFLALANQGQVPATGDRVLSSSQSKRINSIMQTCGFYDQAGEFTFRVGLPGKSGVGGGIAAVKPGEFSVAVWSPELNQYGNSVLGMKALELFTTLTGKSIF